MNFFLLSLIKLAIVMGVLLTTLAYLQWVERKVLGHIQLRLGPYRVGPHGLLQPLADVIKLVTKEGVLPSHVNKFYYFLAPAISVGTAMLAISVLPFGPKIEVAGIPTYMQLTDLNIGLLFVLAASSIGVYGIALAGWASNNKYSLIGGLRSSAQMVSYELPMAIALAGPLLLVNSLSFREIVNGQSGFFFGVLPRWSVFQGPFPQIFAFVIYLIAAFAETNRIPFDLPEAENELVAGYHTEYSSMGFASFFMAEYANMITVSAVATLVFLGGWHPLFPVEYGSAFVPALIFLGAAALMIFHTTQTSGRRWDRFSFPVFAGIALVLAGLFLMPAVQTILVPVFWFAAKTGILLFLFIWVRGTLPRFRYDQLMKFAWGFLFPVAMVNMLITGFMVALFSK